MSEMIDEMNVIGENDKTKEKINSVSECDLVDKNREKQIKEEQCIEDIILGRVTNSINDLLEVQTSKLSDMFDQKLQEIEGKLVEIGQKQENDKQVVIAQLSAENKALNEQLNRKENQIAEKEKTFNQLKKLLEEETQKREMIEKEKNEAVQYKKKNDELSEEIQSLMNRMKPFTPIQNAFECYLKISDETKYLLRNIYVSDEFNAFIAASMQWENIEGIWSFIRRKVIEDDEKDLEYLHRMFLFLFEIYVSQSAEPYYKLICPLLGTKYDSDLNVIKGTKTDGIVSDVLLEGIENCKTKRLLGKAIVIV